MDQFWNSILPVYDTMESAGIRSLDANHIKLLKYLDISSVDCNLPPSNCASSNLDIVSLGSLSQDLYWAVGQNYKLVKV